MVLLLRLLFWVPIEWAASLLLFTVLMIIGILTVPLGIQFGFDGLFWLWGNEDEPGKGSWWNQFKWYWRNPVANFRRIVSEPGDVTSYGATDSMDAVPGFQWRYRYGGWKDSIRISWGKPRKSKGKKDIYIGWKIGSPTPGVGFGFSLQWWIWLGIVLFLLNLSVPLYFLIEELSYRLGD